MLTNNDIVLIAGLGDLLDKDVHHPPEVMVLTLKQLRHSEENLRCEHVPELVQKLAHRQE